MKRKNTTRVVNLTGCSVTAEAAPPTNEHTRAAVVALAEACKANAEAISKAAAALSSGAAAVGTGIAIGKLQ